MTSKYDLENIELPKSWSALPLLTGGIILLAAGAFLSLFSGAGEGSGDKSVRFFMHSYLANFMFVMTIALGALFFILIQFVSRAGWSTSIRRIAELIMTTIPFLALFFLPILAILFADYNVPYEWNVPKDALPSVVKAKIEVGYLTREWFSIRAALYFGLWIAIAFYFFSHSRKQDETGDVEHSLKRQKWSGPSIVIFAFTVSFAAFDWVMSIDADWYSTIFGVYVFAAGMMAFFATMIIISMSLQNAGKLRSFISVEHFHDMGKFMFGFIMFWSYIAFSQLLLYWYANIPEETEWYRVRIDPEYGWQYIAYALIPLHFAVPFLGTISRHVRRHRLGLTFWAVWVIVVHWLDMTFLVMPNSGPASLVPLAGHFLGGVGMFSVFLSFFLMRASNVPLVPMKDPRLPEALTYANPIL